MEASIDRFLTTHAGSLPRSDELVSLQVSQYRGDSIETDELEPFPGLRANILGIIPFINAASTITVKTRERLQDTATESSSATTVTSGINPVRESGRFVRANVKIASGVNYDHAQGVDLSLTRAGVR